MIRVELQPEPLLPEFDFDGLVRKRGLAALAAARGNKPIEKKRGRPAKLHNSIDAEFLRKHAFWQTALDILCKKYRRVCAYSCFRMQPTEGPTVDHYVAITRAEPEYAYEWANYRLASGLMNSRKNRFADVLDPCQIEDHWFALNLGTLEVVPGLGISAETKAAVEQTITRLKLNSPECVSQREKYFNDYMRTDEPLPFRHLEEEAPFLAREMRRQGYLSAASNPLTASR